MATDLLALARPDAIYVEHGADFWSACVRAARTYADAKLASAAATSVDVADVLATDAAQAHIVLVRASNAMP